MTRAILLTTIFSATALAGPVDIRDRAGLFSAADRSMIEKAAAASPFTVHVLTAPDSAGKDAWEADVARAVTASDVLAIGIEKAHRITTVKAGGSTGIPAGNGVRLGEAGNDFFRRGNFGAGIDAIIVRATQVRAATPVVVDVPTSRPGVTQPIVVQTSAATAPPIKEGPGAHGKECLCLEQRADSFAQHSLASVTSHGGGSSWHSCWAT